MVTTPREWMVGQPGMVCVISDVASPAGSLNLNVTRTITHPDKKDEVTVLVPNTPISVPSGRAELCHQVNVSTTVPSTFDNVLSLTGQVGGKKVKHEAKLVFISNDKTTIIQTDKYHYQASQVVNIRIVTFTNPNFNISTDPYRWVYVISPLPSTNYIAQWRDVNNSVGLVHLSMTLVDEPEQGLYFVFVKTVDNKTFSSEFVVKQYVLPRFEVMVETPTYVLLINAMFNFTVCAKYTHGMPVTGDLTVEVNNKGERSCRIVFNITDNISGCKSLDIYAKDIRVLDCSVKSVQLKAIVKEEGTSVVMTETVQVSLASRAITFRFMNADKYLKPNLPYSIQVMAMLPDKSPAAYIPLELCAADVCRNTTSPRDGIISAVIYSPTAHRFTIIAPSIRAVMESTRRTKTIAHFYSPSNSSLLILAPEGPLPCNSSGYTNHTISVLFSSVNQTKANITVQVMSNREIKYLKSKEYELTAGTLPINTTYVIGPPPVRLPGNATIGFINVSFILPVSASPVAKVLVWYTRNDGEVVADSRKMLVEKCLPNAVDVRWSVSQVQPGKTAEINLTAAPNSTCSLGVIDKSMKLLKHQSDPFSLNALFGHVDLQVYNLPNGFTKDNAYCKERLKSEQDSGKYYSYYSNYVDSNAVFNLYVRSLNIRHRIVLPLVQQILPQRKVLTKMRKIGSSDESQMVPGGGRAKQAAPPDESSEEDQRTYFPETLMWDLFTLSSSGGSKRELTMPDTITQWEGMAVCVHPQHGLGVSLKQNITTFTNFFLDLALPTSVKRGEILPVIISVFNNHDVQLPVIVKLVKSLEYAMVLSGEEIEGAHAACVTAHSKMVDVVRIKPLVIGRIMINVTALIDKGASAACRPGNTSIADNDTLVKDIVVEAEGFPREDTWTRYVCSRDMKNMSEMNVTWEVRAPEVMVEGSARAWVTVLGDLFLPSVENLGHLINVPSGSGEQNMLNFAVNVIILQYLKNTNQNHPEIKKKLIDFIEQGYVREFVYARDDGSFSNNGKADESGSTWLTAFVLKSFSQARPFINIDKRKLEKALFWLLEFQNTTGCFYSVGEVINKCMLGGVYGKDSPVPLTAFVLISLLEAGVSPRTAVVTNACSCVTNDTSQDLYTLALKSYALALAKREEVYKVLPKLIERAKVTKDTMNWEIWNDTWKKKSLEVEIAGYAILAMVYSNITIYEPHIRKVIKWITRQRNGHGGFYTTQDTVVAVQAMSVYESYFHEGNLSMVARVTGGGVNHSFTLHEDNRFLTQLVPLTSLPANLTLNVVGKGCVMVQSVLKYNIPTPGGSDAFKLTIKTCSEPDKFCVTKRIKACASYLIPDGKSNLAVMEVNLVSGYAPDRSDLTRITENDLVKKYKVDGSKVTFYISGLTKKETCVSFRVIRESQVENTKPGTILLYDYHLPDLSVSEKYDLPPPSHCK
ncbi:alpha-1-inhibitor 3 [Procambarus clarkii]|uniref:alpha-1-inhibitor 3 n=1 Tax=Procambarus clarkii TaxID=6728 RepID=UPI0037442FDC